MRTVSKCSVIHFGLILLIIGFGIPFAQAQDSYELDDTYDQANILVVNPIDNREYDQSHTFHHADDVDWVKFYVVTDETYIIKAFNSILTDPYIELYGIDGQTFICRQDAGGVGVEEKLDVNSPVCPITEDGLYYAKVGEAAPGNYNSGASYDIALYPSTIFLLPGYLTGIVKNNFNLGVSGATIVFSGTEGSGGAISFGNGSFVAGGRKGSYRVSVTAPGHSSWSGGATISSNIKVVLNRLYNSDPVAVPDEFSLVKGEGVSGNVLLNDTDSDGDPLTAILDSNVAHGVLQFNSNGSFTYTHDEQGGDATFTYYATDGVGNSPTVKVILTLGFGLKNLPFLMLLLDNP